MAKHLQGESLEDLEPLFDYSRVQPENFVNLDDDDFDAFTSVKGNKRKRNHDPSGVKAKETVDNIINLEDDAVDGKRDDEEDWLPPPPPRIPIVASALQEDKTIKELRLKKQELAALAQSAEEAFKTVTENAKREFSNSACALQPEVDKPTKKHVARQKIVISIQDGGGQKPFRVYMDDKLERLFKMYAEKVGLGLDHLVFCFDGDKVGPEATPQGLGLEDDDILEVRVKSS